MPRYIAIFLKSILTEQLVKAVAVALVEVIVERTKTQIDDELMAKLKQCMCKG